MKLLPDLPFLPPGDGIIFPVPDEGEEVAAIGGNLSPGMLLSAYRQGIFPWFNPKDPLIWWSPLKRMILPAGELHISRRMLRIRSSSSLEFRWDTSFDKVIRLCSGIERSGQDGTWIDDRMIEAYTRLHLEGYAHSLEAWSGGTLAGGLYGVSLGRAFFGESMFTLVPNSSKLCFYELHDRLQDRGFHFIDCQLHTPHLETFGARAVPRDLFLQMLEEAIEFPTFTGTWGQYS